MKIVDAQPWHLIAVSLRLPERDQREIAAMGFKNVQDVALRRAVQPGVRFTVLDANGDPQVCFGVAETGVDGVGEMWMLRTIGAERYCKTAHRTVREIVAAGQYRRIETYTKSDSPACRKFVEWLGFAYEGTKRAFFLDGTHLDQFSIVKE